MRKRIVMTGATGFIGSAIAREFLKHGTEIIALVRPNSNLSRLETISNSIRYITYDKLTDSHLVDALTDIPTNIFIHAAWRGVAGNDRNEAFQILDNIPLTIHSVELAHKLGCEQWIGLGSQAEYGNLNKLISEDCPNSPTTTYGKAKLAAGITGLGLCESFNLKGCWLRVFSTYGPADAPHWFLPYVIQEFLANRSPKLTKCEQLWDYLFVDDAARAVHSVASSKACGVFNLGSGMSRPLKSYIETIRKILNSNLVPDYGAISYRPDQVMHLEADISRLQRETGWQPLVNLIDGLALTVEFEQMRNKQNEYH
jgi:nucleoside-diphosphate-sugar epimerase